MADVKHLIQNIDVMGFCEPVKVAMRKPYERWCASNGTETLIDCFSLDQILKESERALPLSEASRGTQHDKKTDATRQ